MKNKVNLVMLIMGCTTILTAGAIGFNQVHKNHQANQLIIEKCFEHFDQEESIVVKKNGLWSPVSCEKG